MEFLISEFGLALKGTESTENGTAESQTGTSNAAVHVAAYYPAYTGKKTTLTAAMTSLGINSAYSNRKQIAKANSITGYLGTAAQNTQMYNLLVSGLLKKI